MKSPLTYTGIALSLLLTGCAIVPYDEAYPSYPYAYGPPAYPPAPVYVGPPVAFGLGIDVHGGGGFHHSHGRWGHWHH